jgi:hypothetical protein
MSSIVSAFDTKLSAKQIGENGHVEHSWSADVDQEIVQFFFQLVRSKDTSDLSKRLYNMLNSMNWREHRIQLTTLYKLIGQTRDIVSGKGEMDLTWMQLEVWSRFSIDLAYSAFVHIVSSTHPALNGHQYGSWKDVKYFLAYLKSNTQQGEHHPLIDPILVTIVVPALREDESKLENKEPVSLLGRWIPREKSSKKFSWIFHRLAEIMYSQFLVLPEGGWRNRDHLMSARKKCKIHLKKLIVKLSGANGGSDTPQVKMAGKEWSKIEFNKVTSVTLRKQKMSILNKDKKGNKRSEEEDRILCAANYTKHVKKAIAGDKSAKVHGKRLNVGQLAKDGYSYHGMGDDEETLRKTINLQWKSQAENNKGLENVPIVAMCDTSGSMESDDCIPLNNAIGLSIRISELCHPAFRDRILTFDAVPKWIKTSECKDFVEKAQTVRNSAWGMNTDFHLAMDEMISALVENNINPNDVRNMVLAVFSDMQFDCSYTNGNIFDDAYLQIKRKFAEAGMRTTWQSPYDPPHLLFWNLRKTTGFPATTYTKNITFLSGYSSTLLNVFCNKGIDALREVTPYTILQDMLNVTRYTPLDDELEKVALWKY